MAMEATSGWLERARQVIEHSQQWQDFTRSLFDAVQQQMAESHVNTFQDFSRAEKVFAMRKAARAIQGGDSYKALMSHVSHCMENEIYRQIAQKTQEGGDLVNNKRDLLLRHLKDGLLILLRKQPELKGKLCSFFNQPLPPDLYHLAWRLHLSDLTARLGYLSQLAANGATSFHGREIFLQYEALLDSEPTFRSLQSNDDTRGRTAERDGKTATTITLKLLEQMMGAASAMVNGSNMEDREFLNAATAEHLQAYHQDYKNAKMEMFGYEIREGEIEDLPEPQRKEVRKKLEAAVRRGAEVRYKAAQRKPQPAPINPMRVL